MNNMAVIGDRASVYGFAALGLDTHFVTDARDATRLIRKLEEDGCAIIYITEQLAATITDELDRIAQNPLPAVIPIPGAFGNNGMGMRAVSDSIIKAVGSEMDV